MTRKNQIYKCNVCGNIVNIMHSSGGTLVCCNQQMSLLNENTTDASTEKHIPVIEKIDTGYKLTVGEVEHPMNVEHYIEWIELIAGNEVYIKHLNPNEKPEAIFQTLASTVTARAYCNLHGLWKK